VRCCPSRKLVRHEFPSDDAGATLQSPDGCSEGALVEVGVDLGAGHGAVPEGLLHEAEIPGPVVHRPVQNPFPGNDG